MTKRRQSLKGGFELSLGGSSEEMIQKTRIPVEDQAEVFLAAAQEQLQETIKQLQDSENSENHLGLDGENVSQDRLHGAMDKERAYFFKPSVMVPSPKRRSPAVEAGKAKRDQARAEILDLAERGAQLAMRIAINKAKIKQLKKLVKNAGAAMMTKTADEFVFEMARNRFRPLKQFMKALRDVAVDCKVFESMHQTLGVDVSCSLP